MKDFLMKLLGENGEISSTRFVMLLNCLSSIILAFYGLAKGVDLVHLAGLISAFIVPSLGAKVMQKSKEDKQ